MLIAHDFFFLRETYCPFNINCIHNGFCVPVVHVLYFRIADFFFLQQSKRCLLYIKKLIKQKEKSLFLRAIMQ